MTQFILAFIPLFVAIDAPGILPLFMSLSKGYSKEEQVSLINQAVMTAFVVAVVFVILGKLIFEFLGITDNDFRIAGGIVLLILAIQDLLFSEVETGRATGGNIGIVPIGIPLIMGPAALTSLVISHDTYGFIPTLFAIVSNLALVWILFKNSGYLLRIMGDGGSKAFAKVASLFLAAISVMMIRVGVQGVLKSPDLKSSTHSDAASQKSATHTPSAH